jgi:hypothetical protein
MPSPGCRRLSSKPLWGAILIFILLLSLLPGGALAQDDARLDTSDMLKPLVDTSQQPLHGTANRQGASSSYKPVVLTGTVRTLQQAIEEEKDTVDWYAWYLACREYLSSTGGLPCALGTPIKFYRNGRIEAQTFDAVCLQSVEGRRFPLPAATRLDALILPVRHGNAPPASPQEIYSRVDSLRHRPDR